MAGVNNITNGIVHSAPVRNVGESVERVIDATASKIKEGVDEFTTSTVNDTTNADKKSVFQQIGHTISQFFSTFSKSISGLFDGLKNFFSSIFGKTAAKEEAANTVEKDITQTTTQQTQQEVEKETAAAQKTGNEGAKDITDPVSKDADTAAEQTEQAVTEETNPQPVKKHTQTVSTVSKEGDKEIPAIQPKGTEAAAEEVAAEKAAAKEVAKENGGKQAEAQTTQDVNTAAEQQGIDTAVSSTTPQTTRELLETIGIEPEFIDEAVHNEEEAAAKASAEALKKEAPKETKPETIASETDVKDTTSETVAKETTSEAEAETTSKTPKEKDHSKKASQPQSKGMGWKGKLGSAVGVTAATIGAALYHSPEERAVFNEGAGMLKGLTTNLTNSTQTQWQGTTAPYGAQLWDYTADKMGGLASKGQSGFHIPGLDDQVFHPGASFLNGNETQYITIPHTAPNAGTPFHQRVIKGLGVMGGKVNQGAHNAWGALENHIPQSPLSWEEQLNLSSNRQGGTAFSNAADYVKPAQAAESSAESAFELNDNVFLQPETAASQGNETFSNVTAMPKAAAKADAEAANGLSFTQFASQAPNRLYNYATGDWTRTKNAYSTALEWSKEGYKQGREILGNALQFQQETLRPASDVLYEQSAKSLRETAPKVQQAYNDFLGKPDVSKQAFKGTDEASQTQFATTGKAAKLATQTPLADSSLSHNLATTTQPNAASHSSNASTLPTGKLANTNASKTVDTVKASSKTATPEPDAEGDIFYETSQTFAPQAEETASTVDKSSAASRQEELDKLFADLLGETPSPTAKPTLASSSSKAATSQTSSTVNPLDAIFDPLFTDTPTKKASIAH